MNKPPRINPNVMIACFWAFIATIITFQLLAAIGYTSERAILYSVIITGTFAAYAHLVAQHVVKRFIESKATPRIPKFVFQILVAGILTAAILTFEDFALDNLFHKTPPVPASTLLQQFFGMFLATILITGMAYAIELTRHYIKTLKDTQTLKDNLNNLEMRSIRQQLSPHFTFNILNNLQFLIQKNKEEALKLLSQYSKLLRYYVYESQNKAIFLNDEVVFLKTYLELEKDSLKDEAKIDVGISIPPNDLKIAPFILSTFVENAFKHVAQNDKWISVSLDFEANELYLKVQNNFEIRPELSNKPKGIGLEQVKKRLQLIYPEHHTLAINTDDGLYSVLLKIKFD